MNNEVCIHGGSAPFALLKSLHGNQGGKGRHMCPTCAYEHGFNAGSKSEVDYQAYCETISGLEQCKEGSYAPTQILKSLGENQGGSGRHKCTNCAFKLGFEAGFSGGDLSTSGLSVASTPVLNLVSTPSLLLPKSRNNKLANQGVDFIKKELRNKKLGLLGEELVVSYEKAFLIKHKREDLVKLVNHVSVTQGDGLGYDILSYDINGKKKYIEVKTTRSDISRHFYLSQNELLFSQQQNRGYFLYRVFDFDTKAKSGKFYKLEGDLSNQLTLEPTTYRACPL